MSTGTPDNSRRRFVRTIGGCIIVAAAPISGCSNFAAGIPDSAIAAWQPEGQSEDPRVRALAWAILAPNPHNLQPWLMELVGTDEVVVRIDTTRLLPETDPFGRQILIGTGAMLGLLDMAASEIGYQTETRWFENGEFTTAIDDRPVARVRFIKSANAQKDPLFQHIATRRTVRQTYDINRMPAAAFNDDMKQLSQTQALSMSVYTRGESAEHASEIAALAKQAWSIELLNPETLMESMRLLRVGSKEIEKHRDGISITAPFLVFLERFGLFDRSKVPDASSSTIQRQISEFESLIDSTPAFLVMTSEDNSRQTQIAVGKAYVRANLHASAQGLVMHPISQALQEYAPMSETYDDAHRLLTNEQSGGQGTVQMLCRVGYLPEGDSMPVASPRRGLSAHLPAENQSNV